jgi:hypothetical protein
VSNPGLGTLGNYGGPTLTIPLLPGSPAIGAGTGTGAPTNDQRGSSRVGAVDIGAFESQGFTITVSSGSNQSAIVGANFSRPLTVTVIANNPPEPVQGGVVSFSAPISGASANLAANSASIVSGTASVTAAAGGNAGSYTVTATVSGVTSPASFSLTNNPPGIATITSTTANGSYNLGAQIDVTVTFSAPVTLAGGALAITLNDGGVVDITPFINSTNASGTYTVAAGQNTAGLDSTGVTLSASATLQDASSNNVALAIPAGHSLGNNAAIVINTAPPTINPLSPPTVADGTTLTFAVVAQSGSGAALSFSVGTPAPAGASINAQTGLLTWSPSQSNGQPPGIYSVIVVATDTRTGQASTAPVNITVGPTSTDQGSGMTARATVAFGLTQSAEYFSNFITGAYNKYLGRGPDANGLAYWVSLMQNGLSDEHLESGFIGSVEYIANHGGAGAGWVQGMYVNLLGRTPAAAEVQYWLNQLAAGDTTAVIAYGFAASQEREAQRVQADYQQFLGRSASSTEVSYWVNVFLNGGSNEKVVAGFVSSQEYFQEHGNNIVDWLYADYRATLNRIPDMTGFQYWESQLH